MTTKITVSVNGAHRVLVTQGNSTAYVSGKGLSGPKEVEFHLNHQGEGLTVGPEEPDNGVDGDAETLG